MSRLYDPALKIHNYLAPNPHHHSPADAEIFTNFQPTGGVVSRHWSYSKLEFGTKRGWIMRWLGWRDVGVKCEWWSGKLWKSTTHSLGRPQNHTIAQWAWVRRTLNNQFHCGGGWCCSRTAHASWSSCFFVIFGDSPRDHATNIKQLVLTRVLWSRLIDHYIVCR